MSLMLVCGVKFSILMMIKNIFKYLFLYIKIKIKNERNDIIIIKKEEEKDRKHTRKKFDGYL